MITSFSVFNSGLNCVCLKCLESLEFELFSMDGKRIMKTKIQQPYVLLPQMAEGVYLIKLGSQAQIDIRKIVIKH